MGWFERRRHQRYLRARQKAWRRKQKVARLSLGDRTAEDIARQVAASELRKRIKIRDQTRLAHDIEELDDHEKLLLTLGAEGLTPRELSRYFFEPLEYVRRDLEGIIQRLREGQERA
jgi:hypothetical protein